LVNEIILYYDARSKKHKKKLVKGKGTIICPHLEGAEI